jgi:protoporphyrinogen oxidase
VTNALFGLGVWNSFLIAASYLKSQLSPELPEDTFDKWVSNRFGSRLYSLFFKTYTEKVWGIPCSEISAEWAAQRIKGLSLMQALKNALLKDNGSEKKEAIKTLIDSFDYPRLGPGMMWEAVADKIARVGCELLLNSDVKKIHVGNGRVERIEISGNEAVESVHGTDYISTMPIRSSYRSSSPRHRKESSLPQLQGFYCFPRYRPPASFPTTDIHTRTRRKTGEDPELQELERGHGARPRKNLSRPRVLLLRG